MFHFLNIKWLLTLAYRISKVFGFFFITINFSSLENLSMTSEYSDYGWFFLNACFSVYSLSYDGFVPLAEVTHSIIIEIGINAMNTLLLLTTCALKITSMMRGREYFAILKNLCWCHRMVCSIENFSA